MGWLQSFFGFGNGEGNGPHYLFWSGIGGIFIPPLLTAVPIVWAVLRSRNCHVHRCWRLGRHPVEGTPFTVCRRHHPDGHVTEADIRKRYHLYLGGKPGRG
jgi:hypothetical protein